MMGASCDDDELLPAQLSNAEVRALVTSFRTAFKRNGRVGSIAADVEDRTLAGN